MSPDPVQNDLKVKTTLKKTHSLALRWFHWLNALVLFIMIWSGILLYWANKDGEVKLFGHQVIPDKLLSPHAPSWIPHWFPTDIGVTDGPPFRALWSFDHRLAEGQAWHFTFMWLFILNGLIYVCYLLFSGKWKRLKPSERSIQKALQVVWADIRFKKPEHGENYNEAQKQAYLSVILMGALMVASGFAIYKPTRFSPLTTLLGGYLFAKWIHFWTTMAICAFILIHVYQVIRAGWPTFRAMISGFDVFEPGPEPTPEPDIPPQSPGSAEVPSHG